MEQVWSHKKNKQAIPFFYCLCFTLLSACSDYFEPPPLSKSIMESSSMDQDLNVVQFMHDIVNELDLNTRIWGKD